MDELLLIQKIIADAKARRIRREFVPLAHHILMKHYGYIPLNEFKKLPIPTVLTLLKQIKEDYKELNK